MVAAPGADGAGRLLAGPQRIGDARGADARMCRHQCPGRAGRSGLTWGCLPGIRCAGSAAAARPPAPAPPPRGEQVGVEIALAAAGEIELHQRALGELLLHQVAGHPGVTHAKAHHVEHLMIVGRLPAGVVRIVPVHRAVDGGCRLIWLWLASTSAVMGSPCSARGWPLRTEEADRLRPAAGRCDPGAGARRASDLPPAAH